jgi:hypothetical protein
MAIFENTLMNVKTIEIEFLSHRTNNFFDVDVLNYKNFAKTSEILDSKNKKIKLEIFSLDENNIIELIILGKKNNDTIIDKNGNILDDTFLETKKILIDNINSDFKTLLNLSSYLPMYSEQELHYLKKNNINTSELKNHDFKFYYNGKLSFNLKNFYWDYNKFLHSGLEKGIHKKQYNQLGLYDEEDIEELNRLLNDLSK